MQEIWDLVVYNFVGCLIIFARVSGIFTFNPIMGRANVPMRVRVAMSMVLTVTVLMSIGGIVGYIPTSIPGFVFLIMKEAAVGLLFGFIVNLTLTVMIYAGEVIDNQVGLGMARVMDPLTGINMPVFANMYYYMFILYFFLTNGHLTYIKLFSMSYDAVPIDFDFSISWLGLSLTIAAYLSTVLTLAVKMAMPIIAAALIMEICVGVVMKAIPTIHIFVLNIQLKVLLGLFMVMALASPMSDFIERLLNTMWDSLFGTLDIIS